MFTLIPFVCSILLVSTAALASPVPSAAGPSINTPLGVAKGLLTPSGVAKFAVKYGSAQRWAAPSLVTTWQLPNGASNVSAEPLACPQSDVDASAMSEDCLSMILYVPKTLNPASNVPTLMWIHGGSFVAGSASGPGLDGSKLAVATGAIVAVVQYRLGALGFLGPDGTTNNGLKDVVTALQFLQKVTPSFGGASSKITIAGQSSGANMVRALLAVPSAQSLFQNAIIQSDPIDYGFLSTDLQSKLTSYFNSGVKCGGTDTSCLNALSLDTIINTQQDLVDNFYYDVDQAVGASQPIRVVHDGSFITSSLTSQFPHVSKPILISTVRNEAGYAIFGGIRDVLPQDQLINAVGATFGDPRTQQIMSSGKYAAPTSNTQSDARPQLQQMGTDYLWKCAAWSLARTYVQNGGQAFVGQYVVGSTYPGNEKVPFCTQNGNICHQDDIEIVFGTVPSPSAAQSKLITEMQTRYKAFLATGNPNSGSLAKWLPATTTNVHALTLGGSGEVAVGNCDPSFWGQAVQYDYQFYNL